METASRLHTSVTCTSPKIGSRVPDYILDILDDAAAEEVETHLATCLHCKTLYVTVLRIRATRDKRTHDSITPFAGNGFPSSSD